jgi:hypothetical protein
MAKDQEEFKELWESVSIILNENESVPTGFTDYCRDLILYAHSIDDIKDDDIDKIKKEDYVNFLLPATNWNNNLFYLNNKAKLGILQHYTIYKWELSNNTSNKHIRRILKCGVITFIGFIVQEHCKNNEIVKRFNEMVNEIILENLNKD